MSWRYMIVWLVAVVAVTIFNRAMDRRAGHDACEDEPEAEADLAPALRAPVLRPEEDTRPTYDLVRRDDPDFDARDFEDRIGRLFVRVHHAIADGDVARIRDFTDDRALAPLAERVARNARAGRVETFKGLRVEGIELVSVTRDGPTERVVLHIAASAATSVTDAATGDLIDPESNGDGIERRRFIEAWTLSRSGTGLSTPWAPPEKCAVCGAPISRESRYTCAYCNADLRGPERDWTLLTFSPW